MTPNLTQTTNNIKKGFTLIEFLIYIALIGIFFSGGIMFVFNIINIQGKTQAIIDVSQNMRFIGDRITFDIRNSRSILDISPTSICLESRNSAYNPTKFYLEDGIIKIGWAGTCQNPDNIENLSSNTVSVTNLFFENLSSGNSTNVGFSITMQSARDDYINASEQTITSATETYSLN